MNEMQSAREAVILDLFREGIGQPCKAPHLHTHREILALSVACADLVFSDCPANDRALCADALAGTVFALQSIFPVNFPQHSEVDCLQMESGFDRNEICAMTIRR